MRGRVVDAETGLPPKSTSLSAVPRQSVGTIVISGSASPYRADGTFELTDVLPGRYWISAQSTLALSPERQGQGAITLSPAEATPRGLASLEITNADVDGVTLTLVRNTSLPGRLSMEGDAAPSAAELKGTTVGIRAVTMDGGPVGPVRSPSTIRPDGTFVFENVFLSEYRVIVDNLPQDAYLKEATYDSVDALAGNIQILGRIAAPPRGAFPAPGILVKRSSRSAKKKT